MNKSNNLVNFGNRVREIRKQQKLTQEKLAEKIGYSANFIGMIERGERNTTIDNMFSIINTLKITPSEFFKIFN